MRDLFAKIKTNEVENAEEDSSSRPGSTYALVEDFFRNESSRMVTSLTRYFGPQHLCLAEDVTQEALLRALQTWTIGGVPPNPSAWVSRVAKNLALDALRHQKLVFDKESELSASIETDQHEVQPDEEVFFEEELGDDLLRMMFVCCPPELPGETRVALILKLLCGFSTSEIGSAFLVKEATIRKRLQRGREVLKETGIEFDFPSRKE